MAESNRNCSRCGDSIEKPVRQNANYVLHTDFAEEQPVEVVYGMFHTEETRKELDRLDEEFDNRDRQALAAEMAHPEADETREVPNGTRVEEREGGKVETADTKEVKFNVPTEKFDHREIDSPTEVQDNDDIALTYTTTERRQVQKTGLACPGCTKADDEIIWGPDG